MEMATKGKLDIIVPGVGDNECLMSNGGGAGGPEGVILQSMWLSVLSLENFDSRIMKGNLWDVWRHKGGRLRVGLA